MQAFVDQIRDLATGYLPTLLLAVAVLVAGWLIALAGAALTRVILKRTTVDDRIARWTTGKGEAEGVGIEPIAGRVVFWVLMAFVLVAFFSVLGLNPVTTPLSQFLDEVFVFLPRLLSAGVLLLLAWIVASGLRFAVRKAVAATKLDERLAAEVGTERDPEQDGKKPSRMVSETVYWLVLLLFLPAILDALALEGLLGPVNELLNKVLAFLPNLLVAGIILAVGWLMARIIQRVVTNLASAVGTDTFGERLQLDKALGDRKLSNLLGLVVYILVLVPVVIAALDAVKLEAVTQPASAMLEQLLEAVPRIFAATVVLFVAYLLARLVSDLVGRLLHGVGFDQALARIGLSSKEKVEPSAGSEPGAVTLRRPSGLVGLIVMVAILLFATIEALRMLDFDALALIVTNFTLFAANVLLGVLIFGLGLFLANLAAEAIRSSSAQHASSLALLSRAAILVLASAMALRQAGIAEDIINMAFGLVFGAVAVAGALAFGLGGRDLAARYLSEWSNRLREGIEEGGSGPGR